MRLLIIGLGQLGSRYLQGLLNGNPDLSVDILEPSDNSYQNGIQVLSSAGGLAGLDVRRVDVSELGTHYSLCIVATSAGPRAEIIRNIASKTCVDNWVVEKVLAQSEKQLQTILDSVRSSKGAWVNTPRRRTSIYRNLKTLLEPSYPITFEANFPNLGLGCNAIHFIDVVSWLVDSPVRDIRIAATKGWKPSKREGYSEFDGQLVATYEDGSALYLNSDSDLTTSIVVKQSDRLFSLIENEGIRIDERFIPGRVEYQSELSHPLIAEILEGCLDQGLPSIQESIIQHKALFDAIRNCEALKISSDQDLPIT